MNTYRLFLITAILAVSFSLSSIGFAQTNESEPNDSCMEAQSVALNPLPWDVSGELISDLNLDPSGDVDFYRFEMVEGTPLRARLFAGGVPSDQSWDPYLGLFDSDCNLIAENDDYLSLNPRIDFVVPPGGIFILAATGCCDPSFEGFHGQEGTYVLRLAAQPVPIEAITGRVVDAVTGDPLPWSWVELVRCIRDVCAYQMNVMNTDESGGFRFETAWDGAPLDPANYLVRASANEYQSAQIGPFTVYSSETMEIGDIALEPPPFLFSNIQPCSNIQAVGDVCRYTVDVRNNTGSAVKGLGWSLVSEWGGTSSWGHSIFPAEKAQQIKIPAHSGNRLEFRFKVPADVADGTYICAEVWFSDRATEFFGTLRSEALFCVEKVAGFTALVSPKEAAARLGVSHLGTWQRENPKTRE